MDHNSERALKVADFLLQIAAVKLSPENPFTWASGIKSPIYCDNRKTLSFPAIRAEIKKAFCEIIREQYPQAEVIAGVATGGIAIGALVAEELDLPFIYVRSEAKKHGLGNQVEGVLHNQQKVVVIEDLVSTGKSSLTAVEALREAGAHIEGMVAIFTYGFEKATTAFKDAQCKLATLSDYDHLIQQAVRSGYVNGDQLATLQEWKLNPEAWKL
jgi:orotate phosphoribosyltransferase